MKTLDKSKMLSQQADFWAEREIMAQSVSPWIVRLFYTFQVIFLILIAISVMQLDVAFVRFVAFTDS